MDYAISVINSTFCAAIAAGLTWAILTRHVFDGIIVKGGLILMTFGFAAVALRFVGAWHLDALRLDHALLLINAGLTVTIIGYGWRSHCEQHWKRRVSDWTDQWNVFVSPRAEGAERRSNDRRKPR
jgi:hypothetical protein